MQQSLLKGNEQICSPDGIIVNKETVETEKIGVECLIYRKTHFVKIEEYRKAAFVYMHVLIYKERWP